MKYYKENGFFDRLEKLSDWIDFEINDLMWAFEEYLEDLHTFGFLYFVPGMRHLAVSRYFIKYHTEELKKEREIYNKGKFWWMAEK